MSYRLQPEERLPQGIERIAREQIDEALAHLEAPEEDKLDEAIHESRKCFKKLRGLLRLVRLKIGEDVFERENVCFRDAGRLLSDLRDSVVKIKTLDSLTEEFNQTINNDPFAQLREELVDAHRATRQRVVIEEQGLARASEMISAARKRVPGWPVNEHDFSAVEGGLHKVYKRGRNRLADAWDEPVAEAFHEWRKRVKYLWYNVRILRPIWPDLMESLADEIHDLSDYLGDEHDLAELKRLLTERPSLLNDEAAQNTLFALIEQKRATLQADAFRQGQRIYPEEPADFVARLEKYWLASQLSTEVILPA